MTWSIFSRTLCASGPGSLFYVWRDCWCASFFPIYSLGRHSAKSSIFPNSFSWSSQIEVMFCFRDAVSVQHRFFFPFFVFRFFNSIHSVMKHGTTFSFGSIVTACVGFQYCFGFFSRFMLALHASFCSLLLGASKGYALWVFSVQGCSLACPICLRLFLAWCLSFVIAPVVFVLSHHRSPFPFVFRDSSYGWFPPFAMQWVNFCVFHLFSQSALRLWSVLFFSLANTWDCEPSIRDDRLVLYS